MDETRYSNFIYVIVLFFFFLFSCNRENHSEKSSKIQNIVEHASAADSITLGNRDYEIIDTSLDKYPIINELILSPTNLDHPYETIEKGDYDYVISRGNFKVYRYEKNFEKKLNSIGNTGRGPGEGSYINAYVITSEEILLYDSSMQKLVCFDLKGNLKYEKIINSDHFPFVINSLKHVSRDTYLATGISKIQQKNLSQKKSYNNLYLVKINSSNIDVIDNESILPENVIKGIEENDVVASTVSSPFKLSRFGENFFLYNMTSSQVYIIKVADNSIDVDYVLSLNDKLFKHHPKLSEREYNQSDEKRSEWMYNGNYMIKVFSNKDFLMFYTSKFDKEKIVYNLLVVDRDSLKVEKKIEYTDQKIIRSVNNESVSFFEFSKEANSYKYSLININDLLHL